MEIAVNNNDLEYILSQNFSKTTLSNILEIAIKQSRYEIIKYYVDQGIDSIMVIGAINKNTSNHILNLILELLKRDFELLKTRDDEYLYHLCMKICAAGNIDLISKFCQYLDEENQEFLHTNKILFLQAFTQNDDLALFCAACNNFPNIFPIPDLDEQYITNTFSNLISANIESIQIGDIDWYSMWISRLLSSNNLSLAEMLLRAKPVNEEINWQHVIDHANISTIQTLEWLADQTSDLKHLNQINIEITKWLHTKNYIRINDRMLVDAIMRMDKECVEWLISLNYPWEWSNIIEAVMKGTVSNLKYCLSVVPKKIFIDRGSEFLKNSSRHPKISENPLRLSIISEYPLTRVPTMRPVINDSPPKSNDIKISYQKLACLAMQSNHPPILEYIILFLQESKALNWDNLYEMIIHQHMLVTIINCLQELDHYYNNGYCGERWKYVKTIYKKF